MLKADAFAFDDVDAHGRAVEQQVDDVVIEQVNFVDVEDAAVGGGEDARLEMAFAALDGFLDVQRADDTIFGGADGQVHERRGAVFGRELAGLGEPLLAFVAEQVGPIRIAAEAAALYDLDVREQRSQRACGGGFGGAAFAADEYAADLGIDRVQNKGAFHPFLADDGGKRIGGSYRLSFDSKALHNA